MSKRAITLPDLLQRAAVDLPFFAYWFFPQAFRLPFAPFHHDVFADHLRMSSVPLAERTGERLALAAPRGSAKSTLVSYLLLLHDVLYQREPYIILISATQRQAEQRLRAIRMELLQNPVLRKINPPWFAHQDFSTTERVLMVGQTRVEAFGAGVEMRGISHNGWRPTKIILDDVESSASAMSPRRRARLKQWFAEVIEPLGQRQTHLLIIGTVLHRESLLAELLERPDFHARRYASIDAFPPNTPEWQAWRELLVTPVELGDPLSARDKARAYFLNHQQTMTEGSRVLWPESEDIEQLMAQLQLQGRRSFYQEKQNQPQGPEDSLFHPSEYWAARRNPTGWEVRSPWGTPARPAVVRSHHGGELQFVAHLDSALGKSKATQQGDFAAIAVVALTSDGQYLAVECWIKRASPSEQIQALLDLHQTYGFQRVTLEGTGFQELLQEPLQEACRARGFPGGIPPFRVEMVKPTLKKELRIARLEPFLCSGRLALSAELPEEFWRELADYPRCAHDDALDALAGALDAAEKLQKQTHTQPVQLFTKQLQRRTPSL